ncbi:MBL fold metallo-hydrolase [Halomicrobium salinisoli]|uniref:MBL fold metallo-hydrolase n=1 Tax=Halomicrobium salinisoli TaxID=2878391 RepID=UPI001CF090BE|nr:MBL fold metallo-hydrolase [Halomicrobium salinisoli]
MTVRHDGLAVEWLGYATIRLAGEERVVYTDPGRYGVLTGEWEPDSEDLTHPPSRDYRAEDGDVVCVSHVHHYDPDGIERVASDDATVVAFEGIDDGAKKRGLPPLSDLPYDVERVGAKDKLTVGDVEIWTTPAKNEPDGPHTRPDGTPYHPEGFGCGFVVAVEGTRAFWPGDTDVLPGHRTMGSMDVSLFCPPIGQRFTMDRREAAGLAVRIDPDLVMPVHYDTFSTLGADSKAFAAAVAAEGIPVVLDEK